MADITNILTNDPVNKKHIVSVSGDKIPASMIKISSDAGNSIVAGSDGGVHSGGDGFVKKAGDTMDGGLTMKSVVFFSNGSGGVLGQGGNIAVCADAQPQTINGIHKDSPSPLTIVAGANEITFLPYTQNSNPDFERIVGSNPYIDPFKPFKLALFQNITFYRYYSDGEYFWLIKADPHAIGHEQKPDPHVQYQAADTLPIFNMLQCSGKLTCYDSEKVTVDKNSATFEWTPELPLFNGATATAAAANNVSAGDLAINQSSTFGGSGLAVADDTKLFMDAIAGAGGAQRFSAEYYVGTITVGNGTNFQDSGTGAYPVFDTSRIRMSGFQGKIRFASYILVKNGQIKVPTGCLVYINGIYKPAGSILDSSAGVVFWEAFDLYNENTAGAPNGLVCPAIYANNGTVFKIALPLVTSGWARPWMRHKNPVRSLDKKKEVFFAHGSEVMIFNNNSATGSTTTPIIFSSSNIPPNVKKLHLRLYSQVFKSENASTSENFGVEIQVQRQGQPLPYIYSEAKFNNVSTPINTQHQAIDTGDFVMVLQPTDTSIEVVRTITGSPTSALTRIFLIGYEVY